MAQWQDQSYVEILVDKGYDGAFVHYFAIAHNLSILDHWYCTGGIFKDLEKWHNRLEMAKQEALTLMPVFNGN